MFIIFNKTKKIEDMITELGLALEEYIGFARRDGIYNSKSQPIGVRTLETKDENGRLILDSETKTIVIEDVIDSYSSDNEDTYYIKAESKELKDIEVEKIDAHAINLKLKTIELTKYIADLRKLSYTVKLYSDEQHKGAKTIVAIKGDSIKFGIERDFIELHIDEKRVPYRMV